MTFRKEVRAALADLDGRMTAIKQSFDVKVAAPPLNLGVAQVVVIADPLVVASDKAIEVKVTVSGATGIPTGSVTLYDNGRALNGTTKELFYGSCSGTLTYHVSGTHILTARYSGDAHYEPQPTSGVATVEVH